MVLDWLAMPWFHAVMGNHEQMAIQYFNNEIPAGFLATNGGVWFIDMQPYQRIDYAMAFQKLPTAIEIETGGGIIGVVHAECPSSHWDFFANRLRMGGIVAQTAADAAMWSRNRIDFRDADAVYGVKAVVVGHTPVNEVVSLGNTIYIDTMGWRGKDFTILDAETLKPAKKAEALT